MAKRLRDRITSQYIEAANLLAPRHSRRRIVAYVESYDDIFFWRSVLSRFENADRYFEVMLPSRQQHLERGKKAAIMSLISNGQVGRDMIACVDADYDYLAQGATEQSRTICSSPYIFHSYAYAIENMQCYAPSLHDVCVAATLNDHVQFDFERFMADYSTAIFPLFVWNIWSYRTGQMPHFAMSDFLRTIEVGSITPDSSAEVLATLRRRVGRKVAQLQREHPDARDSYAEVKDDIKRLGVTPEQTYMYIQGHHLMDKVVMPLLKKTCNRLMREREREITCQSIHSTQRRNELSCYTSSVGDVEFVIRRNVGFAASEQYQQVIADLRRYLDGDSGAPGADTQNTATGNKQSEELGDVENKA